MRPADPASGTMRRSLIDPIDDGAALTAQLRAEVAEQADASVSNTDDRKVVRVRSPPSAPTISCVKQAQPRRALSVDPGRAALGPKASRG